jgi:N-acetylglucosamine kinase-like BadF-type ATPase
MKDTILGLDGGGTNTTCLLFDNEGNTIDVIKDAGTNIYVFKEKGIELILNMIRYVLDRNKLNYSDIAAYGLGIAGISDIDYREVLLKELDRRRITEKTVLLSDAEAAYKILCPTHKELLLNIGTGIICFAKDKKGKIFKEGGLGHDKGDIGSGYWIGKEMFSRLILNEATALVDNDLLQFFDVISNKFKISSFRELYSEIEKRENIFSILASLGEDAIDLAESGNDIALSIVQEGTRCVAEYLISLCQKTNIPNTDIIIGINGSIINNKFYRKLLEESLQFDFKKVNWLTSILSPAYGAGLLAAEYKGFDISLNDIVKRIGN